MTRMSLAPARLAIASLAAMSAVAASADLTITDLAPRQSVAVVSIDDYGALRAAFDRTGFAALLKEPAMKEWMRSLAPKQQESLRESLKGVGLDFADLPEPTGSIGGAVWVDPVAASPMIGHMMLIADFGPDADRFDEAIDAVLDRAEDRDHIRVFFDEIEGADVREIEFLDRDDEMFDDDLLTFASRLFIARRDGMFLLCSDEDELARALQRAAGEAQDAVRDRVELIESRDAINPAHLYMTAFAEPLVDAVSRALASDRGVEAAGGVVFDLRPMLEALGLSSIRALAYGVEFDAPEAMLVSRAALLSRHREGLLALFDQPLGRFEPPAFVTADASDVRLINFDFGNIIPLVNQVIAALPQEARFQTQVLAGFITAAAGPMLQTLGPETVYAKTIEHPLSVDSEKQLFAMRANDPDAITTGIQQLAGMAGLESRVFQGDTIWGSPFGPSMAVASGHLIIGAGETVETAIRQSVNAQAPRLADEARFKRAAAFTSPGAVYYTWSDFGAALEYTIWSMENWDVGLRAQLEGVGFSKEEIDEWIAEEREFREDGALNATPPVETLRRHLGDLVGETHATDKGFIFRNAWLAPD